MKTQRSVLLGTVATIALGVSFGAMAQQSAGSGVEEIVVTAQRRTEALETVPMAITVVSPQAVAKAGVNSFMELGRLAVGAQMNYAGSVPTVAIHGITTAVSGYNVEPNVAIYLDGFYSPGTASISGDLTNLDSIQVLKGPQGTLYGRNATGGAILINTRGPSKEFMGNFDASYGRFNENIFNGFVSGPISDRIRFSISAHSRRSDGWIRLASPTTVGATAGNASPINVGTVGTKLEADVSDNLTALAAFNYTYSADYSANNFAVFGHINPLAEPAPPLRATVYGTVANNRSNKFFFIKYEPTLTLTYKSSIGTLTSHTGYATLATKNFVEFDGTRLDISNTAIRYTQNTFQQALDYNITAIDKLDLLVGGLYYRDVMTSPPGSGASSFGAGYKLSTFTLWKQVSEAFAAYVDGTYHITDQLSLTAGGRFNHDKRAMQNFEILNAAGAFLTGPISSQKSWNKFTPRVNVRYELAPRTDVYASWTRGFRSGAFNASGPGKAGVPFPPVNPENIDAFEVGFKTAQSMVRYTSSAFYYNYTGYQVNTTIPDPYCTVAPCGIIATLANAPGAKVYGWDNEVSVNPTESITLHAGVSLLHARFKPYHNATGTGVNATNTLNVSGQTQDWTGLRLPRAPDVSGNAGFDYEVPISSGTLLFTGNVNFTTSFPVSTPATFGPLAPAGLQNVERFVQTTYALVSGQVKWTAPSEAYYVSIYGTNLTNQNYRLSYNGSAFGDYSVKGEPISYGVKVGMKF
ncbi:MAG: TonB-dependent receptor [Rhodospirillaceae bacterium]|nr:MAG: TonB-dependent receptor [Rhodospirillaceae bacterium]